MSSRFTRRQVLIGAAGLAGTAGISGAIAVVADNLFWSPRLVAPTAPVVARTEAARRRAGAATVTATLTARPVTLD